MKIELSLEEANIISQGLRLKRESLLRSRNREISGSKLFNLYNEQLQELTSVETKLFSLVDAGVK